MLAVCRPASADDLIGHRYAIASLIGNQMTVVVREPVTGSNVDHNRRVAIPDPTGALDEAALLAAQSQLKRLDGLATAALLTSGDAELVRQLNAAVAAATPDSPPVDALKEIFKDEVADRLIVITKHRADAMLKLKQRDTGDGKLEGLGFYIDASLRVIDGRTGETARGYLGPYAYLAVSLFDANTLRLVAREVVTDSYTYSAATSPNGNDPWQALSTSEKMAVLRQLIQRGLGRALPDLLAAGARP